MFLKMLLSQIFVNVINNLHLTSLSYFIVVGDYFDVFICSLLVMLLPLL